MSLLDTKFYLREKLEPSLTLLSVACGSISACKTIWSMQSNSTPWFHVAANCGKVRERIFSTCALLSLSLSSSLANNNTALKSSNLCSYKPEKLHCEDMRWLVQTIWKPPPYPYWQSCWMCLRLLTHQQCMSYYGDLQRYVNGLEHCINCTYSGTKLLNSVINRT